MTNEERISGLMSWGYTEREAKFIVLAALTSGYFLRRQYCERRGKAAASFIDKLNRQGHCKTIFLQGDRRLYHISYTPLYEVIGDRENRNRRSDHYMGTIKARVMALDYILQNPR